MANEKRQPVGYVTATVRFPLYDGDNKIPMNPDAGFTSGDFPWFEYREPGISDEHEIGVCTRECVTLSASVSMDP